MNVGDQVPDVEATLDDGTTVALARLGKPLVLFFYPKAFSPVCTAEACRFRDRMPDFESLGAVVYGVAPDEAVTLREFARRHSFNFPFISDHERRLAAAFGAVGLFGMTRRLTVVADEVGVAAMVYANPLDANGHSERALAALRALAAG